MNIPILYESLNSAEKAELVQLLNREGIKSRQDLNLIPDWIEKHRDQLTEKILSLLMNMYVHDGYRFINQVDKKYFMVHRNIGVKTWLEFTSVRGY